MAPAPMMTYLTGQLYGSMDVVQITSGAHANERD